MKKTVVIIAASALLVSSCGTYQGSGTYIGAQFGTILGSAIGGISGGPRGSDIGTIVGMASGAVLGGAIGAAKDRQDAQEVHDRYQQVQERKARQQAQGNYGNYGNYGSNNYDSNDSGFDATNSGDDRLYDFNSSDYTGSYSAQPGTTVMPGSSSVEPLAMGMEYLPAIEIRNARIVDDNQDKVISRNEVCKVIFEVYNHGKTPVMDVVPTVVETTGNKHIYISPNMHIERIDPGKGVRYTAMLKADNRLKDGTIRICASVLQGNNAISKVCEFNVPTRR
ncbi:MAG: hypothetical protein K6C10_01840 [Prevotella sp.]|nr:hypothetical protein [Prevotella sp.]